MVGLLIGFLPYISLNLINALSFGYFKPTTLYLLPKLVLVWNVILVPVSSVLSPTPWVIHVWNFVLSLFIYLSDLQILSSLLEYKWFYYVIKNMTSTTEREIILIENSQS